MAIETCETIWEAQLQVVQVVKQVSHEGVETIYII